MKSKIIKRLIVFVMGILIGVVQTTVFCADIIVDSYTKGGLPAPGTAGRLARVTDNTRGLWMDQGLQWFGMNGEVINAKEVGAKGDGVTDDTAVLQAAIDVASPNRVPLYIPPGRYVVSNLLLRIGLRMSGAGIGLTTLLQKPNSPVNTYMLQSAGAGNNDIHISQMTLDGNGSNQTDEVGVYRAAGLSSFISFITFDTVEFSNAGPQTGVPNTYSIWGVGIDHFIIRNCRFQDQRGIRLENTTDTLIDGNLFNNLKFHLLDIYGGGTSYVTNTKFVNNTVIGTAPFQSNPFTADGPGATFTIVANNYFSVPTDPSGNLVGDLLTFARGSHYNIVNGNTVNGTGDVTVNFSGPNGNAGNVAVGNAFKILGPAANTSGGIYLTGTVDSVVVGNLITDVPNAPSTAAGIELYSNDADGATPTKNNVVVGNKVSSSLSTSPLIRIRRQNAGVTRDNLVVGNIGGVQAPDVMTTDSIYGVTALNLFTPGIGNNSVPAVNIRGSVTISDANTSAVVTFATAEPDASYFLTVTPTAITGTPATGSNRIKSISKTASDFTITLDAAPGSGKSRTFDWHLIR